ncbi:SDR family NAD(P)-dependent oxidoreductase [Tumebacillus flagellatus]|uniref:SDR family NAD(P)-dependent oxidoreductase n=1 Tax=Tumebacillus flagellatus TaxID=1157490 RepID=UPI00056ED687|nr:SDR family NAD(P)-dependent oxidoreductase [Tumebacillus flagellatus]
MEALKGKVAIITGANQGIGLAVAKSLAAEGVSLGLGSNKADELRAAADELRAAGANVVDVPLDVRNPVQVEDLVKQTLEAFGTIDFVINNAGVTYFGGVQQCTETEWDDTLNINVKGYFLLTKAVLPTLIEKQGGHIINMSSIWGKKGSATMVAYSTSKFAIEGFTQSLIEEVKPHGIKVTSIVLDKVDTQFRDNMTAFVNFSEEQKARMITAEDVADSVLYALSSSPRSLPASIHLDAYLWK